MIRSDPRAEDPPTVPALFDYRTVTPASIQAATEEGVARADALLAEVVRPRPVRTFDDTLLPLDRVIRVLTRAYGRGAFLARVHPDRAVREAAVAADERIEKWHAQARAADDLDQAVREYAASPEAAALTGERRRFLERWLVDLRRAGHGLPAQDRAELRVLRDRLIEIEVAFQRNLDDYEDGLDLTRDELVGLPEAFLERLRPGEAPGTLHVGLDYPEVYPFLADARRRDLRREMERRLLLRAAAQNRPLLEEALGIRQRIAGLFGCPSWAHFALEVKMARRPENVQAFYEDLVPGLQRREADELATLSAMLRADTGDSVLHTWDVRYYDAQLLRNEYGVDAEQVAEFFPLDRVLEGLLSVTGEVFGVRYRQLPGAPTWHPDVLTYEILDADSGAVLALFYADLFPREGKFSHAAAFPLAAGHRHDDGRRGCPAVAIVANFTAPSNDRPALLRHEEVVTLFHEFGHVLHHSLVDTSLARFAAIESDWEADFVEAPSQILEHWAWEPEVLRRFARHYRTAEPIPPDLVERLVAARDLDVAYRTLRQCYMGLLDLGLHDAATERDLDEINRQAHQVTGLDVPEGTFAPASFEHLFGGYDAGYYGYLWSKVFGDDMFSRFAAEGILSPVVGRAYRRCILEPGSARDAADLLRDFLGRPPSNAAFLRGLGIEPPAPS